MVATGVVKIKRMFEFYRKVLAGPSASILLFKRLFKRGQARKSGANTTSGSQGEFEQLLQER